jgi:hypothetical protein
VDARILGAQVLLYMAPFPGKTGRTVAAEIVDQVGASSVERARILITIVDVDVAIRTGPSRQTDAFVSAEFQRLAVGPVFARILTGAGIDDLGTAGSGETGSAQAFGRSQSRQVLTDAAIRTLDADTLVRSEFALVARVILRTDTLETVSVVFACRAVEAGLRQTGIHVLFAEDARKSRPAQALDSVVDDRASAFILALYGRTFDFLTQFSRRSSGSGSERIVGTFDTSLLADTRLEEVDGARGARL